VDIEESIVGQLVQVELGHMTGSTDARGGLIATYGLPLGADVPVQGSANGLAKYGHMLKTCIEIVSVHRASDLRADADHHGPAELSKKEFS
jgi:hypothetical protein